MEHWMDIIGFPGYQVSDYGNIRSFYCPIGYGGGTCIGTHKTPKILSQTPVGDAGHLRVFLYENGKRHALLVHRIVAEHFIPNPKKFTVVRHLNDDPTDNRACNLAWGTQKDNVYDCINRGRMDYSGMLEYNENRKTPIIATNIKTGIQRQFKSQNEAARELGISQRNIWFALRDNKIINNYSFTRYVGGNQCLT